MGKISQKMYVALTRGGVSAETALRISEATEFLGDSTKESMERDNYDILLAAKSISSLVRRHKDIAPIMPKLPEEPSADMTRVGNTVKSSEDNEDIPFDPPIKKKTKLVDRVKKSSPELQKFWAHTLPILSCISIFLLFIASIVLSIASIAAMIAITIGGIVFFIIGLLYGVSQFSVFTGAAYFEIGLGLVGGGLAVLITVFVYNFLTRTLPFCRKEGTAALKRLITDFTSLKSELAGSPKKKA